MPPTETRIVPTLTVFLCAAAGLALGGMATGTSCHLPVLVISSVHAAAQGELTVEVERARALQKRSASSPSDAAACARLAPARYVWIPKRSDAPCGKILTLPHVARPYDAGWRTNLASYFGLVPMLPFHPLAERYIRRAHQPGL